MNAIRRACAVVFLAFAAALPSSASAQSSCVQPAEACAFFSRFLTALNKRDWPAYRATLDDSISVFLEDPAPAQRFDGRPAAESLFIQIFPPAGTPASALLPPIVPVHLRIQSFGDVSVISFEIVRPQSVSRRTLIAHRGANGWRMVHIHGSARPLPET
jgi:ketosteroid isomerase-like protein